MMLVGIVILAAALYLTFYAMYLFLLLVASLIPEKDFARNRDKTTLFAIIIPAHNEEIYLGRLLTSIRLQDYPKEHYEAVVIADNCTDNTASVANENGAVVYERHDLRATGKGYALKYGLDKIVLDKYNAVVILDADCMLDTKVLSVFDQYLHFGYNILQSSCAPANPGQSWFTQLINISHTVSNEILLKGKKRLGFSIPLMGQGMCFSSKILKQYAWNAFSVGEDLEFYGHLLADGQQILYAKEAKVFHQESHNLKQATSQRIRWSSGRLAVALNCGFKLLLVGICNMDFRKIDGSLSLLLPNPSLGINLTLFMLMCATILTKIGLSKAYFIWFLAILLYQAGFFALGIVYSKEKGRTLQAVILAPVFLTWKIAIDLLSILGRGRKKWVPTKRIR
jgi:cellulose synthase/poly-beta-1,6-N-acetylglucosamine synthase-like glycosyltransferase